VEEGLKNNLSLFYRNEQTVRGYPVPKAFGAGYPFAQQIRNNMKRLGLFLILLLNLSLFSSLLLTQEEKPPEKKIRSKVTPRWELNFSSQPPKVFTYVTRSGKKENYLYVIYTLTNNTDDNIKLGIDVCIRTILEKEKEPEKEKEKPEKDKYYQDVIHPFIEDEIIVQEEKLSGLGIGIQKDRIKELKKELQYLNCKEQREKREIKPKETIKGIAIFNEIHPKTVKLEMMVGGLFDVIKWRYQPPPNPEGTTIEEKVVYEYECRIWKISYECPGEEFTNQTRPLKEIKKEWIIREYGPIGSLKNIESLIEGLQEHNPLLQSIGQYLLERLTGNNFGYDWRKLPEDQDNEKAILRWHEWWDRNKEHLVYNLRLNKFEIKEPEK
jgi:hypothetical protein